jgi:demethylmenaquinone methyltransferase/2-methoxy-6-polyprenyl-1,4-benzoquinol methylase
MQTPTGAHDALLPAAKNQEMFDAIVPRYDLLNRLMTLGLDRYWRRRTVQALSPAPNKHYMDVGCGTGALCLTLLQLEPTATVAGIDPSHAMLAQALKQMRRHGISDAVQLDPGDACAIDADDQTFDGVMSGFCIRNITDRHLAFSEMLRVLRPGGRMVALELTRPPNPLLRFGHAAYNRTIVPLLGRLLSRGNAYRYLTDSVEYFPETSWIVDEMIDVGFTDLSATPLTGGIVTIFSGQRPDVQEEPY